MPPSDIFFGDSNIIKPSLSHQNEGLLVLFYYQWKKETHTYLLESKSKELEALYLKSRRDSNIPFCTCYKKLLVENG